MKKQLKETKSLGSLASAFYSLAIGNMALEMVSNGLLKGMAQEERNKSRLLRRRGLVIVKIINKKSIETYQELKGIEKTLELFVKKNKKWSWEIEKIAGIKTRVYILQRKYRRYYRKAKEPDYCPECGREYE